MLFNNTDFWNHRYRWFPQLGSGPSSRGYAALYKQEVIKRVIAEHDVRSILDIGCGDMCWLDQEILDRCRYLGLDIAAVAVERGRAAHPAAGFALFDITTQPFAGDYDLVVSFDPLIHKIDRSTFDTAVDNVLATIRKMGLISYTTPPAKDGSWPPPAGPNPGSDRQLEAERRYQTWLRYAPDRPGASFAFHGPLPEIVAGLRPELKVRALGRYRHHTIYAIS